jgi:signal-transduction protein with cAMP-binding, CBS, and nucleotidyltransferase domain
VQVEDQLKVTFLDTVPLLQPLTRRELTQLAGVVTTEEYEAEPIIEYGVRGDSMFILREGEAQAERHGVVLKTYSAGDFFGASSPYRKELLVPMWGWLGCHGCGGGCRGSRPSLTQRACR